MAAQMHRKAAGRPSGVERDLAAAARLRELRENRGLSPEQLPYFMARAGVEPVSGKTIRRIEGKGAIPQVRVKFALASFFGVTVSTIWSQFERAGVSQ